ncbi:hypothetical protein J1N10_07925 [Carboxylicivirga sp. A043]|uniref:hypothetical protein n=1 Tax=Carboxylicivirga litoralis TaxID=2816963 RepID=UPI0021CB0B0F|nr:hypothetical protein [Carboxylicivirga sp. A043]MCU4155900.1 hypothetical protein [Carboxylicivirga sp. A043]
MKCYLTILLLFMSFLVSSAQETTILSNNGQKKLLQIYQSPENDFLSLMTQPEKPTPEGEYLRLYHLFIAFQAYERKLYLNSFHKGLQQFETSFEPSPKSQIMFVTLLIQQSLLHWNQNELTDGARSFYKAHRLFRKLDKKQYTDDYLKLESIFNIFLSQIPEQFQFLASLFGLEGNIELGFQQLEKYTLVAKQHADSYCEALVLEAYCQLKFGQADNKQVQLLMQESADCHSPLLQFVIGSLAVKNKMSDKGLTYINTIDKKAFESFPLIRYLKGRLLLNQLDSACLTSLKAFDGNYQGYSFRTDALMRQAWWFHIQEETLKRDSLINQVLQQKHLPTSNDKQAQKEITSLANEPVSLLKARLLFDGAHYLQAKKILTKIDTSTINSYYRPEYHYRMGKINKELKLNNAALICFDEVMRLSQDDTRYFGPHAAIEAAKIKLLQHDTIRANQYLIEAQYLNTGQYKQDISRIISSMTNE